MRRAVSVSILLLFMVGCAGMAGNTVKDTSVPDAIVTTYEGVALSLNAVKMFIRGQEVSGKLKGAELDAKILQWEQARLLFLQAGDALKDSVSAKTPQEQTSRMQAYNALLQKAALELGKLQGGK